MSKQTIGFFSVGALAVFVMTALAQPPEGRDKDPGKKGPPPAWAPGKIVPPHVRDMLELTDEQEKQIGDLEKEVRAKLLKIFTGEQVQRLQDMRDKGPKGPPPDKGKGKKKDQDKDYYRERPSYEETKLDVARCSIVAWLTGDDCSGGRR